MKKTPWFPAAIKPARKGVYRVVKSFGEVWAHWDGRTWSHGFAGRELLRTKVDWMRQMHNADAYPITKWRGLAEQPK
jgi:hypothetical protein